MRTLRKITEDEMVAAFLKAEINSTRFGNRILDGLQRDGFDRRIIDKPNLDNKEENKYRKGLLGKYRGYMTSRALFQNFPDEVEWERVILEKEDLSRLKYINYDYWVELSSGTRRVKAAVENIKKGIEIFGENNKQFFELAEKIKQGEKLPEIILVSVDRTSDPVILEGHVRATAYMLYPEHTPEELEAIIGYSENFKKWGFF